MDFRTVWSKRTADNFRAKTTAGQCGCYHHCFLSPPIFRSPKLWPNCTSDLPVAIGSISRGVASNQIIYVCHNFNFWSTCHFATISRPGGRSYKAARDRGREILASHSFMRRLPLVQAGGHLLLRVPWSGPSQSRSHDIVPKILSMGNHLHKLPTALKPILNFNSGTTGDFHISETLRLVQPS